MVRGFGVFRDHFYDYSDQFVIIGGTACSVLFEDAGIDFRGTKDIDIVLFIEKLDDNFGKAFWEFVKTVNYKNQQKSTGKQLFYRFFNPADETFPYMLELFGRSQGKFSASDEAKITRIPISEDVSSLSAILMDEDYYNFIQLTRRMIEGVPIITELTLIPLKAKAWLDLRKRKNDGENVDSKDIKKHRNDVFRLYQLLSEESKVNLPSSIAEDLRMFIELVQDEGNVNLKTFGIRNTKLEELLESLKRTYNLAI
ncbi:hypothetical protein K8I28_13865 [bacterium]|nr:hypothetical protein [bacterium]